MPASTPVFTNILCAVDGTRTSTEAVKMATTLAGPGGHLTLLAVTAVGGSGAFTSAAITPSRAKRILSVAKQIAAKAGVPSSTVVDPGSPPVDVILERARNYDLLVMGAPAISWLGSMLIGGVATVASHILTLSPPISLEPRWLSPHVGYTIAKYGMTLCALGLAAEFAEDGIASNALWPRTLIATAAVQNLLGGEEAMARARKPELYADAAYAVITKPSRDCSGNAFLCEDVLAAAGVTDFDRYAYLPGAEPQVDMFVDHV